MTPWESFLFPHERAALRAWQRAHERRQRARLSDWWRYATWMP